MTHSRPIDALPTGANEFAQRTIEIKLLGAADTPQVLELWRRLESTIAQPALTCSSAWTETWLKHFGDYVNHHFALAYDQNGDLRSIVLLCESENTKDGPFPVRTLHVGTAGELDEDSVCVEYNKLLVMPQYRELVESALSATLQRWKGVDQWNLDGFTEDDIRFLSPPTKHGWQTNVEIAHWIDLAEVRESEKDLLPTFKSANRRKVKRSIQSLPDLHVDWPDTIQDSVEILEQMMRFHQERWTSLGKAGCYSSRRFTRFHEDLLVRLVPDDQMHLIRVRSGGTTVGCVQLLIDQNRACVYQCGWSPDFAANSPGIAVDFMAMQECLKRGYDAYDFLAFETQHKRTLSNRSTPIVWASRRKPRIKYTALNFLRKVKHIITKPSQSK